MINNSIGQFMFDWREEDQRDGRGAKLSQCIGFGHVVVSEIFRERLFLCLAGSVIAPSLSDRDGSLTDFRPRPTFLSSFSEPSDSRFDFRRWRCGGWFCASIVSRRCFLFASQNISCRWTISEYLRARTISIKIFNINLIVMFNEIIWKLHITQD